MPRARSFFLALTLALLPLRATGEPDALVPLPPQPPGVPFPATDWPEGQLAPVADAALVAALERAFAEPEPERLRGTRAVVVVHGGRIVGERYAEGFSRDTRLLGWSMTKSLMGTLVGVLVGDGRLHVDAPAAVPAWQFADDPRREIRLDHLLRMSSGLDWNESYAVSLHLPDVLQMLYGRGHGDMAAFAADRPLASSPGTVWRYSSGTTLVLSGIVRRVLADDATYHAFPKRALFDAIGMTSAEMELDAAGTFVGSSYSWATPRDWARFGLLHLRDGVWNATRILPQGWVDYERTPAPAAPRGEYGAQFWLNAGVPAKGVEAPLPRAPRDLFYAAGHDGQFVFVIPSRDLVIVRLGLTPSDGRWSYEDFVADVVAAVDSR
jgi:CubicO group peptidase (beta-lactamase class C family)